MLKKTMTYIDYNGVERTEDFYFNLTKAEIMEMQLGTEGGLVDYIEKIVAAKDTTSIVAIFKELILKSYGEKSADGRKFLKSKEISDSFSHTAAYADLYVELALDSSEAAAFVNGIMPPAEEEDTTKKPGSLTVDK